MDNRKKIEIEVDGRPFVVVGDYDKKYIEEIAYYVNKKIKSLTEKNKRLDSLKAATLACLNIADELQLSKLKNKEIERQNHELSNKVKKIDVLQFGNNQTDKYEAENKKLIEIIRTLRERINVLETELKNNKKNF